MNYQQHLANSAAIRAEIQRFESVHPNIYSIYELLEQVDEPQLQNQIREHVIAIEGRAEGGRMLRAALGSRGGREAVGTPFKQCNSGEDGGNPSENHRLSLTNGLSAVALIEIVARKLSSRTRRTIVEDLEAQCQQTFENTLVRSENCKTQK